MAQNKKNQFDQQDIDIALIAKALSHPARIAIIRALARRNTCICGEIVQMLPLSQSTVSQHLKELKDVGIIQGSIDGPRSCYCLDHQRLSWCMQKLSMFFNESTTEIIS